MNCDWEINLNKNCKFGEGKLRHCWVKNSGASYTYMKTVSNLYDGGTLSTVRRASIIQSAVIVKLGTHSPQSVPGSFFVTTSGNQIDVEITLYKFMFNKITAVE